MNQLTINLDQTSRVPLYEQIYSYIKLEIESGKLALKSRLPSTRSLAVYLGVSRSTVDFAYDQLTAEGYIESVPAKGYYVSDIKLLYNIKVSDVKAGNKLMDIRKIYEVDFSPHGIDTSNFPMTVWRKAAKNILSQDNTSLLSAGSAKGDVEFRKTISEYLFRARGVLCSEQQIILGAGHEYLLMLLSQLLRLKNNADYTGVIMESPTYPQAFKSFSRLGYKVEPVKMDSAGIIPDELKHKESSLVYVMPSHQFPTGIVMPIKRRLEILEWAGKKEKRYIIEDDYDSEFRYRGKPIPALQGVGNHEKVIYLGSFSKSITPAIRISYMALPMSLMQFYDEKADFFTSTVSRLDQQIVNEFIVQGYYERHLNKMRALYKVKQEILINALKNWNPQIQITGENSGLHVIIEAPEGMQESEMELNAKSAGIKVYPLSEYYIESDESDQIRSGFLLGYASLKEIEIEKGIALLGKAWNMT